MTIVLIDMDGTLANLEKEIYDRAKTTGLVLPPLETRKSFYIEDDIPPGPTRDTIHSGLWDILINPGLFASLEPIPGSIEAYQQMTQAGHDVRICTMPLDSNPTCKADKLAWVDRYLGSSAVDKLIFAADKSQVEGDVLFDDRPGAATYKATRIPPWKHILCDFWPYTRDVIHNRRITSWDQWESALSTCN